MTFLGGEAKNELLIAQVHWLHSLDGCYISAKTVVGFITCSPKNHISKAVVLQLPKPLT